MKQYKLVKMIETTTKLFPVIRTAAAAATNEFEPTPQMTLTDSIRARQSSSSVRQPKLTNDDSIRRSEFPPFLPLGNKPTKSRNMSRDV